MRVTLDEVICPATGQCGIVCPEVFEVQMVSMVRMEYPDPLLHSRVQDAADSCPTGAILVHDDRPNAIKENAVVSWLAHRRRYAT